MWYRTASVLECLKSKSVTYIRNLFGNVHKKTSLEQEQLIETRHPGTWLWHPTDGLLKKGPLSWVTWSFLIGRPGSVLLRAVHRVAAGGTMRAEGDPRTCMWDPWPDLLLNLRQWLLWWCLIPGLLLEVVPYSPFYFPHSDQPVQ